MELYLATGVGARRRPSASLVKQMPKLCHPSFTVGSMSTPEPTSARIALSTTGSLVEAQTIARTLVDSQLVACVNIVPGVHSIYHWDGRTTESAEHLLLIKTDARHLDAVEARIKSLHSYQVPEWIVLVPESGSAGYLSWLHQSLSLSSDKEPPSI